MLRRGLAKKPEDRYPNCSNFVGALEMACAESRGWTTLTAGAAAEMPTVGVKRPQPQPKAADSWRVLPAPGIVQEVPSHPGSSPSILIPLLLSVMVVVGVAGVITWEAGLLPAGLVFWHRSVVCAESKFRTANKRTKTRSANRTGRTADTGCRCSDAKK